MKHEESLIQMQLVGWFRIQYPKLSPLLIHVPNGVNTNPKTGERLRRMGLTKGVPDMALFVPTKFYHGLFIELKSQKGIIQGYQRDYLDLLQEQGYHVAICRGFEAAQTEVNEYLSTR